MKDLLLKLARRALGLDFLPTAREAGAITLVNASGYQWGVETAETGVNVESFSANYKPEQKEYLRNTVGTKIGFAVDDPEGSISISGEVNGSSGLLAATFASATTLANDHADFGLTSGGVYMDDVTLEQGRQAWKKFSATYTKNKNIP
jgi:hypothetical protein